MKSKYLARTLISSLTFSLILFLCAGRTDYFQGWIFLSANLATALMNFWAIRNDPALMQERSKVGPDAKAWDKRILGFSALVYLITLVVAGLDSGRYRWSPSFHWGVYLLGIVLTIVGQVIFLTARRENKFFSSVVRIQTDRGHTVCDTGLYKIVRHPGYSGMALSLVAIPLLTGSVWSIFPTAIAIVLLVLRTYLEDETLKKELAGYPEYTQSTRQRLIPGIW